jgi:hypothetical protein
MTAQERLAYELRRSESLNRWLVDQKGWTVVAVAEHYGIHRKLVERWPFEVLPWVNTTPDSLRETRRYRPKDVFAADALLRAWRASREAGTEEEFLSNRRHAIASRDSLIVDIALGQVA